MRHLPVIDESILDRIGIARPCDAEWSAMKGDDQVRFCGSCRQNVYDISALTRAEAVLLLGRRGKRPCLRLLRREDGRLVTEDCRERLRKARTRGLRAFAAAVVVVGFSQIVLRLAGLGSIWSLFGGVTRDAPRVPAALVEDGVRPTVAAPTPMGKPALPPPHQYMAGAPDVMPGTLLGELAAPPAAKNPPVRAKRRTWHVKGEAAVMDTLITGQSVDSIDGLVR